VHRGVGVYSVFDVRLDGSKSSSIHSIHDQRASARRRRRHRRVGGGPYRPV
jgi:hypothetical protein